MARKRYVLDTSALFTLIEEEDGADRVEEIVSTGNACLPSLALLEVQYVTRQERGQGEADHMSGEAGAPVVTIRSPAASAFPWREGIRQAAQDLLGIPRRGAFAFGVGAQREAPDVVR